MKQQNYMQKITTFLWFNGQAEEAARFYTKLFKNSKMGRISYYGDEFPGDMKGKVMLAEFKLEGQEFIALNGNADFKLTPAISLFVRCKTQKEVDHFWNKLEGREGDTMRVADGQVRSHLADRAGNSAQTNTRQGQGESRSHDAGNDEDGEAGYCEVEEGVCGEVRRFYD
jgi:predicted 3-demethylubiquinone-9 3-methyltransferase (glyoxalase superfamily)